MHYFWMTNSLTSCFIFTLTARYTDTPATVQKVPWKRVWVLWLALVFPITQPQILREFFKFYLNGEGNKIEFFWRCLFIVNWSVSSFRRLVMDSSVPVVDWGSNILYNIILFFVEWKKYCPFIYCNLFYNILVTSLWKQNNQNYHTVVITTIYRREDT